MGVIMNRISQGELTIALAVFSILSCSKTNPTEIPLLNDSTAVDASRVVASAGVTLARALIKVGETTEATVTLLDSRGKPIRRKVTWSSSNPSIATVSASGLVAGLSVGTAAIIATCDGISASATLTVTDAFVTSGSSNEPSGMTVISERPFNALNELGWADGFGSGQFDFRSDSTSEKSPPNVLHAWYPAGYVGGDGPVAFEPGPLGNKKTVYVSYWIKYSANFYGHPAGGNKQFYLITSTNDNPVFFVSGYTAGGGAAAIVPYVQLQGAISWSPYPGSGNLGPNLVPTAQIVRGQWSRIEVVAVGNTAGNADGSVDVFLNGVHVSHYAMQWQTGVTTWNRFHGTTIWGGVGGTVPYLMSVDWDHVYISGKP